jgi:tripartite-type tricarboxylate transporter receptor subunit TctC
MISRTIKSVAGLACALFLAAPSQAQSFPTQAVRIVVPYAPGGASDNVARPLGNRLSEELGVPVVIENRAGAAGNIAVDLVARAKPDGYTLLMGNVSTNSINPWTYKSVVNSDARTALVPITQVASIPHVIAASPQFPPNNLRELVEYAKKNPGVLNYGSAGTGTYAHIDMQRIADKANIDMVHIPYDGGAGPLLLALMGNQIHLSFLNASSAIEAVRAGKMKALAVTWPERLKELPELETMAEAGFEGIGTNAWQGLFAPVGTPPEVIEKLQKAVKKALADDGIQASYEKLKIFPTPSDSPEAFRRDVQADTDKWGKIVKDYKISIS